MRLPAWLKVSFTVILGGFVILHLFFPSVKIDTTTVLLLFLVVVVWFFPFLRGIELPGGLKLDFREQMEHIEAKFSQSNTFRGAQQSASVGQADKIDVLATIKSLQKDMELGIDSIQERAQQDEILALAQLRIEMEKKLRELAGRRLDGQETAKVPLFRIINLLEERVIDRNFADGLRDLLAITNRAVHGDKPPRDVTIRAIGIGVIVLSLLDEQIARQGKSP